MSSRSIFCCVQSPDPRSPPPGLVTRRSRACGRGQVKSAADGTQMSSARRESTCRSPRWIIVHICHRKEDRMQVIRIMPNLRVADVEAAKGFYTGYLGLSTEEFNMGWVARYTSPDTRTRVQLVTRDATGPEHPVL